MPKLMYRIVKFSPEKRRIVDQIVAIIAEYTKRRRDLTLRQLYYQMVSRDLFPAEWADEKTGSTNNQRSYNKLGDIVADARMAGLVDWHTISDRTRMLRKRPEWEKPSDLVEVCARTFRIPRWSNQRYQPEVWIEKDAGIGTIEDVCEENSLPYFSCRGYTSLSEIWVASQRLLAHILKGKKPVIIHLGDHDPSGIDMSRDIEDRLRTFIVTDMVRNIKDAGERKKRIDELFENLPFEFQRIALNFDQVQEYQPPPNPAKTTDARARKYIERFGEES